MSRNLRVRTIAWPTERQSNSSAACAKQCGCAVASSGFALRADQAIGDHAIFRRAVVPRVASAVLNDAVARFQQDLCPVIEFHHHFAGDDDVEIDGIGGVHAWVVSLRRLRYSGQLLSQLFNLGGSGRLPGVRLLSVRLLRTRACCAPRAARREAAGPARCRWKNEYAEAEAVRGRKISVMRRLGAIGGKLGL